jgi:hypothetical protein
MAHIVAGDALAGNGQRRVHGARVGKKTREENGEGGVREGEGER